MVEVVLARALDSATSATALHDRLERQPDTLDASNYRAAAIRSVQESWQAQMAALEAGLEALQHRDAQPHRLRRQGKDDLLRQVAEASQALEALTRRAADETRSLDSED